MIFYDILLVFDFECVTTTKTTKFVLKSNLIREEKLIFMLKNLFSKCFFMFLSLHHYFGVVYVN